MPGRLSGLVPAVGKLETPIPGVWIIHCDNDDGIVQEFVSKEVVRRSDAPARVSSTLHDVALQEAIHSDASDGVFDH